MEMILALDLGLQMGWALSEGGTIMSGSCSLKGDRFEGGGMRYVRLRRYLHNLLDESSNRRGPFQSSQVYYEEVRRHASTSAGHVYGGFLATAQALFEERQIPYQGVPVGTIKKHATGRGNANKDLMIKAARARGHNPVDDNEADAICILYWALENGLSQP